MLRLGVVSLLSVGLLSACGHTPEERAVSGALIGATAGAIVGLASQPERDDYYERDRYYDRRYERPPPATTAIATAAGAIAAMTVGTITIDVTGPSRTLLPTFADLAADHHA